MGGGRTVDVSRAFELPLNAPQPCIAVMTKGAAILLPKSELEHLVQSEHGDQATKNIESVSAFYRASQAKRILSLASAEMAQYGCATGIARVEALRDAAGLVVDMLQAGNVAVVDANTGKLASQIVINYESYKDPGWGGSGSIHAYLPDDWEAVKNLPRSERLRLMQQQQRQPIVSALWWIQ